MAVNPIAPIPAHRAVAFNGVPIAQDASGQNAAQNSADKTNDKTAGDAHKFSFHDLLDIINPLQHIPIVSTIYREITGDKISNFSRVAGGALFGGFIGAIVGGVNAIAAQETGKDVGELAWSKISGHKDPAQPQAQKTELASAQVPAKASGVTPSAVPQNIPLIEVHPQPQQAAIKPSAGFDPLLDKAGAVAATSNTTAHAVPAPLQAQLRHFDSVASMPPQVAQDQVALPPKKSLADLANTNESETESGDEPSNAPVAISQVQDQMLQALAKYQALQGDSQAAH